MPDEWTPPDGFTLTRLPAHYFDARGKGAARRPAEPMADGQIDVLWWNEDEPFIYSANDGRGPYATDETKAAAAAGNHVMGWNPNVTPKPIQGGYVPPQFKLVWDDDPTPKIEPATAAPRDLTPSQEAQALRDGIDAAQARLADIEGSKP